MAYKTHRCIGCTPISAGQIKKKQNTNISCDEINIMTIINDNTFNPHNNFLNNENKYMKVTQKSKIIGVARELILADHCGFQTYKWHIRPRGILIDILVKKEKKRSSPYELSNMVN